MSDIVVKDSSAHAASCVALAFADAGVFNDSHCCGGAGEADVSHGGGPGGALYAAERREFRFTLFDLLLIAEKEPGI